MRSEEQDSFFSKTNDQKQAVMDAIVLHETNIAVHEQSPTYVDESSRGVCRYQASRDDLVVYAALSKAPDASSAPHVARWFSHIKALLGAR